jgi:hypothetical protein
MSASREPTAWQRRFLSGDPTVLDDFAAEIDELSGCVLALMTGSGDWEVDARGFLNEIWCGSARAETAFTRNDFETSAGISADRARPAIGALTALLREKVLKVEFFGF